jgi:hypothetical protein
MVKEFTATLQQSPHRGGWTYIVWPDSVTPFGPRPFTKVRITVDGHVFHSSFKTQGDGWHKVPVKAGIRKAIGKQAGDDVTVRLEQRTENYNAPWDDRRAKW